MNSIKSKLMFWLMAWITAILGSTGLFSYLHKQAIDEADYQAQRTTVRSRLALALPNSVWQLDDEQVQLILDSELNWSSAIAIRVQGNAGFYLGRIRQAQHLRNLAPNEAISAEDKFSLPIFYQGKHALGTVTVWLSRQALVQRKREQLMELLAQIVLLDALIFLIMSFNLKRFLFQPLSRLQQALDTAIRTPDASSARIVHHAQDELGGIVTGFNQIVERTAADLAKRTAAEARARAEEERAKEAYRQLMEAQQTLFETEKMASLGSLVAGVAHEINTPVGITLTTASHLGVITTQLLEQVNHGQIKKSDFQDYLSTAQECSDLILSNTERAANLIHSFKQVAVDQTSEARRIFRLHNYLNEVITSLKPRFKPTNTQINVLCAEDIMMDSYPGALAQVVTNLMVNALVHGFEQHERGSILLQVQQQSTHTIVLSISDDGHGIAPEHLGRIFEPFFTTKRGSGGSGLGLNIVYNMVKQRLGGSIEVTSQLKQGTTFRITLPCTAPDHFIKENI